MRPFKDHLVSLASASLLLALAACSSVRGEKSGQELATVGPTVIQVRTIPDTIELNKRLQPKDSAEVIAEVKDFTSQVKDVRVRFIRVPLEIPMQYIGGTTWRAQLTPQQLRTLAVSGETMVYEANVVARNADGQTAVSSEPLKVAVKTPDLAESAKG